MTRPARPTNAAPTSGPNPDTGRRHRTEPLTARWQADDGAAIAAVMVMAIVLALIALTFLGDSLSNYNTATRNAEAQRATAAADAGADRYASVLMQQPDADTQRMVRGEATRYAAGASNVNCASPTGTQGVTYLTAAATTTQTVQFLGATPRWTYPCGFNNWAPVDEADWSNYQACRMTTPASTTACNALYAKQAYEYSLMVRPRRNGELSIAAAGRRIDANLSDNAARIVEYSYRPTSIAAWQWASAGDLTFGPSTATNGPVWSAGTVTHNGTANAAVVGRAVTGCDTSTHLCANGTWSSTGGQFGADAGACANRPLFYILDTSLAATNCHSPANIAIPQPEPNRIDDARIAVRTRVEDTNAGGTPNSTLAKVVSLPVASAATGTTATVQLMPQNLPSGTNGFKLAFTYPSNVPTLTITACTPRTDVAANPLVPPGANARNVFEWSATCSAAPIGFAGTAIATTYTLTGASQLLVHAQVPVIVEGTYAVPTTIVSLDSITVGNDLVPASYANAGLDATMGLLARNDIVFPTWAPTTLTVQAALVAETGNVHDAANTAYCANDAASCSARCTTAQTTATTYTDPTTCFVRKTALNFTGSIYTADQPSISGFASRTYNVDSRFATLAPPYWPGSAQAMQRTRAIDRPPTWTTMT